MGLVCALCVALVPRSEARRGDDDDRDELTTILTLKRTDVAPENARGMVELEVGHRGDPTSKRIEVDTFNLANGTYTVTVFDAGGASAVLGTFTVGIGNDDDNDDNSGPGGNRAARRGGDDDNDEGEGDFTIPETVNAWALTWISISDAGGADVLTGDFTDASSMQRDRVFSVTPVSGGEVTPDVSGRSSIKGRIKRGKSNGQFRFEARGLPAATTVILNVDGEEVATARTDKRGRLRIRKSAKDLNIFAISTVSIRDEAGTELAGAQF